MHVNLSEQVLVMCLSQVVQMHSLQFHLQVSLLFMLYQRIHAHHLTTQMVLHLVKVLVQLSLSHMSML